MDWMIQKCLRKAKPKSPGGYHTDVPGVKLLPLKINGKMVNYSTELRLAKVKDARPFAEVVRPS